MDITIDLSGLIAVAQTNPFLVLWYLFVRLGWIPALILLVRYFWVMRLDNLQGKFLASFPYTLLAIDVPKLNEQSSKAVEQIFAQLAGAKSGANLIEKYFKGKTQESFSLELVSLGGYIQFLIRTPAHFRDLVEAAVYAQYPDAEITEVDDYTAVLPKNYPSEEYEVWGTELKLAKKHCYPIRTYPMFEHALKQVYADPMAALLEIMSRLGQGESLWIQWVITPIGDEWKEACQREVKKLIGAKVERKETLFDKAMKQVGSITGGASDIFIYGLGSAPIKTEAGKAEQAEPSLVTYLSPGERAVVEAIEAKMGKVAFQTKCRIIYAAKHEVYNKAKGVAGIIGAMQQFSALNLNSFAPVDKITTKIDYFMVKRRTAERQRKIVRAYRDRSKGAGWGKGMILNIEELATVWHFPIAAVKAPLLKTIEAKKAEPPFELPVEIVEPTAAIVPKPRAAEALPPENLPV